MKDKKTNLPRRMSDIWSKNSYKVLKPIVVLLLIIVASLSSHAASYNVTLEVGKSKTVFLGDRVWTAVCSDPTVVSFQVDPKGDYVIFTALKPGTATCDVNYFLDNVGYIRTYVIEAIDVQSITIPRTLTLTVGDEYNFSPIIQDSKMEGYLLKWDCLDSSIATIDSDYSYEERIPNCIGNGCYKTVYVRGGNLVTHKPGTTQIVCTYKNVSATCQLTVEPIYISEINFENQNYELEELQSAKIDPVILPQNATHKDLNWKSADSSIAFVDSKGNVTAVNKGRTVITATSKDGSQISGNYMLTVTSEDKGTELEFGIEDFAQFTTMIDRDKPFSLSLKSPSENWRINTFNVNDKDAIGELNNGVYSVSQIASPTKIQVSYAYDGTIEFYDLTSYQEPVLTDNGIQLSRVGTQLCLSNLETGNVVKVYTIGGSLIGSHTVKGSSLSINLDSDYYIISIDGKSFKVRI